MMEKRERGRDKDRETETETEREDEKEEEKMMQRRGKKGTKKPILILPCPEANRRKVGSKITTDITRQVPIVCETVPVKWPTAT